MSVWTSPTPTISGSPWAAKLPGPTVPTKVQKQLLPDPGASLPTSSFLFGNATVLILSQTLSHTYIQFS